MFGMPNYDELNKQAVPNQYSDGNIGGAVDNTSWMQPSGSGDSTLAGDSGSGWTGGASGFSGFGENVMRQNPSMSMPSLPPSETAIEAIGNGWGFGSSVGNAMTGNSNQPINQPQQAQQNYGAAPAGFEADKWADPTKGTTLKYQVGRMAAMGMPIEEIAAKVGAKAISRDKIQYPDGFVADIYFDEENATGGRRVQYTDVTPEGQYKPGSAPTMNKMGSAAGNAMSQIQPGQFGAGMDMNQLLQQMMFMQNQAKRGTTAARTKRLRGYGSGGQTQTPLV